MPQFLIPVFLCFFGTYFVFIRFWHGFDAISGDIGDARFNAYVMEHTWLWLKGIHPALFDMQMFYPHSNTYAYSDYMLGFAPVYWFFRAIGCEILLSYQWWMVVCSVLNFAVFYLFAKKLFQFNTIFSALGAFVFAFSLPRVMHLEHCQLVAQFFIVISAAGALMWWRDPTSKKAPWFFFTGVVLQLISAFYFFWFWIWTLGIYGIYVLMNQGRRDTAKKWFASVPKSSVVWPIIVNGCLALPFLYHYALAGKEFGRRDWVSISHTVPRLYSWISLPSNHWEWAFTPLKEAISQLPMLHEHYLSFGLFTWVGMMAALIWVYRRKPELKYLSIPLITMFIFTITSGRFSTWVLMSYFYPGAGVIRAVGRIQIFMLMFWSVIFVSFLSNGWNSAEKKKKIGVGVVILLFFAESAFTSEWTFSRAQDRERLEKIAQNIPQDCQLLVNPAGFLPNSDFTNIDVVMIAYQTNRTAVNGYSGHQPNDYRDPATAQKWTNLNAYDGMNVCKLQ